MIFKPRQKRIHNDFSIMLNDCAVDRVKEIVFLGVILDEHISWKPHISHVARRISKSMGIICKLYYSLVYPYLQYCITIWGSTYVGDCLTYFRYLVIICSLIFYLL